MVKDDFPSSLKIFFVQKIFRFEIILVLSFFIFYPLGPGFFPKNQVFAQGLFKEVPIEVPSLLPYPISKGQDFPQIDAFAIFVLDLPSKTVIFEKNAKETFPPASLIKLVTAMVSLETCSFDQIVEVSEINVEGTKMELEKGEKISLLNLLYGLLLPSGNDAAEVLATSCDGSREVFVDKMNQKAKILGLLNSHFANPTGLSDRQNFSTAFDLSLLAQQALAQPLIAEIVKTSKITVTSFDGNKRHDLSNLNQLLDEVQGVKGVKTGTFNSFENLITYLERGDRKILIVLLGSKDRFLDTKKIIDWSLENFYYLNF